MIQTLPTSPDEIAVLYRLFLCNGSIRKMVVERDGSEPVVTLELRPEVKTLSFPHAPWNVTVDELQSALTKARGDDCLDRKRVE